MADVSQGRIRKAKKATQHRVDFKFSFRATEVPEEWGKLVVSMISPSSGKARLKTLKAPVKDGVCAWVETMIKSTKLAVGSDERSYEPKIYSFLVSKGSTRSDILGQAEMDVGSLAMSDKEAHISLLLRNCTAGTHLHVVVQCDNASRPGRRSWDRLSWPRQSCCPTNVVPQHEIVTVAQTSVGWVAETDETMMLSERMADSGSSMQLYSKTQKELVEHLHTVIRNLADDIAALEEHLRGATIQVRSARDRAPVTELPSGKELDEKTAHLDLGKSDRKALLFGSAVQGRLAGSELPENEQLPACERLKAKDFGDFLLVSDGVDRLPDKGGSSENQINDLLAKIHLQTSELAELQSKIDDLEKLKAQLECRLLEEKEHKDQRFRQAILHSEAIEGMTARIQDLELVKLHLESQLHGALEDVRHRESPIEPHQDIPEKKFGREYDSQRLGPAAVETFLGRIGRSESQLEYLERHHVPGKHGFEFDSKLKRLRSRNIQLESQVAEERKKNTDLMDMLQVYARTAIDSDGKVAQLENLKTELEKHLLHALKGAKHARAHLEELQELLREFQGHFGNLTREVNNIRREARDNLTTGTGAVAHCKVGAHVLEHQPIVATEVRELAGAQWKQSWGPIAGQERTGQPEVLQITEVETLLNRIDRSEEKSNMIFRHHTVPGPECPDLELKSTGFVACKSALEAPLLEDRESRKYQLDDIVTGLDEHASTARKLEARILTKEVGKEELQQHLVDAVAGCKRDKAHIESLCAKLEKAQVSGCFEMEAVLSRIDQSEEQIQHILEYYSMPNSKQLEMEAAAEESAISQVESQLGEETKTTQYHHDEFWQREALKSEDSVLQSRLLQSQGEVRPLIGMPREIHEEISTPYQVSLVVNVESKVEALERQPFEARERSGITRSQSQEFVRYLHHEIARLEQAEAKIQYPEASNSRLDDQLYEESSSQSSYHLDLMQAHMTGSQRQIEGRVDTLQLARGALESRMPEFQIGLNCAESSDVFEQNQTEDKSGVKIIQHGREIEVGHRWMNAFEGENKSLLQTISMLEKLVVSLSSEKVHLAKELYRCHEELDGCKADVVQLMDQSPQRVALIVNIVARDQATDRQLLEAQEEGRLSWPQIEELERQLAVLLTANRSQNDSIAEMELRVKQLDTVRIALEDQLFVSQEGMRQSLSDLDLLGVHIAARDKEIDCQVEQLRMARAGLESRLQELEIDFEVENRSNHVLLHPYGGGGDEHKAISLEQLKAFEFESVKVFHIFSKLEGLIVSLSRDRTELKLHLENLQEELEEHRNQPPERVSLVMHVEARDEMFRRHFEAAQDEDGLTKAQIQQLHSQLNVQLSIIKELELQVIELESTRIRLEEQAAHPQDDRRQTTSDIGVLQLRIATFEKEIESRVDDLQIAKASLEGRLNELQTMFKVADGKLKHEAPGVAFSDSGLEAHFKLPETKNAKCLEIIPNLEKQIVTFTADRSDFDTQLDCCQNEQVSCFGHRDPCIESSIRYPPLNLAVKDKQVHKEIHEVQRDRDSSSANIDLKDQLVAQDELIKDLEAEVRVLESVNGKLEDQLRQSHEDRRQSMSHLDTLQVQLEAFDIEIASKVEDLRKARASLESKMQIFQPDMQDVTGSESMYLSICEYDEVDGDSGSGLDSLLPQSNTKLQARVGAFEKENARFVQMHAKLEAQLSCLVSERDRYKAESKRAKEELTDMRSQIETHLSAKLRLETTALALGQSNEDLESQLKEFEDGNVQLSSMVYELEQKLERLTEENASYKLQTEPQESMTTLAQTDHEEMNVHDIAEDNLRLMQTIARLESELVQAAEERASVQSKLKIVDFGIVNAALEKHRDKHVTDLETEVAELRRSKDELNNELGEKIEGLLVVLQEQEARAVEAQDSIHELRVEHNRDLEKLKAEIRQHMEELATAVNEKGRRALQAMQEASELRSEELVWKERMRQMQELVRHAAAEAASIKVEFDARVQDLVAECQSSKEQERDMQLRLQEALKELEEVRAHGKCSSLGHGKQNSATELFQAQLDISRLAIEKLIETERRALEASLQRLEAGNRLVVDGNDGKTLCRATENVYPPCGNCIGVESYIPTNRIGGGDHCGEGSDERSALAVHWNKKRAGKAHAQGDYFERGVSHPCRSQGRTANFTFPSDKHMQVWNTTLSTRHPRQEFIIAPLAQHRDCLYYLEELQYLWLRFKDLDES